VAITQLARREGKRARAIAHQLPQRERRKPPIATASLVRAGHTDARCVAKGSYCTFFLLPGTVIVRVSPLRNFFSFAGSCQVEGSRGQAGGTWLPLGLV